MDEVIVPEKKLHDMHEELFAKRKAEAIALLGKPLDDTSKIEAFDRLRKQALVNVTDAIDQGYGHLSDDSKHYLYEAVMTETLGKNVFRILRLLDR